MYFETQINAGFHILTAVIVKSNIVWYVTPCSLVEIY
jgi:hypothetical protein